MRTPDLVGKKFGRLQVLAKDEERKNSHDIYWLCRCDCGKLVTLRKDHFAYKYSHQKSCGCLHSESSSERMRERHERRRAALCKQC